MSALGPIPLIRPTLPLKLLLVVFLWKSPLVLGGNFPEVIPAIEARVAQVADEDFSDDPLFVFQFPGPDTNYCFGENGAPVFRRVGKNDEGKKVVVLGGDEDGLANYKSKNTYIVLKRMEKDNKNNLYFILYAYVREALPTEKENVATVGGKNYIVELDSFIHRDHNKNQGSALGHLHCVGTIFAPCKSDANILKPSVGRPPTDKAPVPYNSSIPLELENPRKKSENSENDFFFDFELSPQDMRLIVALHTLLLKDLYDMKNKPDEKKLEKFVDGVERIGKLRTRKAKNYGDIGFNTLMGLDGYELAPGEKDRLLFLDLKQIKALIDKRANSTTIGGRSSDDDEYEDEDEIRIPLISLRLGKRSLHRFKRDMESGVSKMENGAFETMGRALQQRRRRAIEKDERPPKKMGIESESEPGIIEKRSTIVRPPKKMGIELESESRVIEKRSTIVRPPKKMGIISSSSESGRTEMRSARAADKEKKYHVTPFSSDVALFSQPGWMTSNLEVENVKDGPKFNSLMYYGYGPCQFSPEPKQSDISTLADAPAAVNHYLSYLRMQCKPELKKLINGLVTDGYLVLDADKTFKIPPGLKVLNKAKLTRKEANQLTLAFEMAAFSKGIKNYAPSGTGWFDTTFTPHESILLQMMADGIDELKTLSPTVHLLKVLRSLALTSRTLFIKTLQDTYRYKINNCEDCEKDQPKKNSPAAFLLYHHFIVKEVLGGLGSGSKKTKELYQDYYSKNYEAISKKVKSIYLKIK